MSSDSGAAVTEFAEMADPYRRELLAHCYRMLGSYQDAEDLVQETLMRAWRGYDRFDGRSSLRTWLHRIATNACLTALASADRRILPSGLGGPTDSEHPDLSKLDATPWLQPAPTADLLHEADDPAAIVALRDSTRLALIAAYQVLPARQRAVLLLVDVAAFSPAEVADLLDISVTAVRSLLQRARSTIASDLPDQDRVVPSPDLDTEVLRRYLVAFEAGDAKLLADLLRADVTYEMPPIARWFQGRASVLDHHHRRVFAHRRTALLTSANGYPALAMYAGEPDGSFRAHGIHLIEQHDGAITRIVVFLNPELFPTFGRPIVLPQRPA
ncbi:MULTISPECIES: RNA polymerase subunit sigma-70 [unclassified Pseudofrankia]|uniref:RNA polymerase subunit sigma-70 n=1 Tax=unclassified Pseudofrankia TaxID=2994372 RepID=UPI0009F3C821|nr:MULTISPECIES: RNA polymerase subunit sigma-70 [unclassified Pseudofrankia]MDT3443637.1 RNA polymerase subunit sigma-70 [Pseudofrankia sp. BMG5.37]